MFKFLKSFCFSNVFINGIPNFCALESFIKFPAIVSVSIILNDDREKAFDVKYIPKKLVSNKSPTYFINGSHSNILLSAFKLLS